MFPYHTLFHFTVFPSSFSLLINRIKKKKKTKMYCRQRDAGQHTSCIQVTDIIFLHLKRIPVGQ